MKYVKVHPLMWNPKDSSLIRNVVLDPEYQMRENVLGGLYAEPGDYLLTTRVAVNGASVSGQPSSVSILQYEMTATPDGIGILAQPIKSRVRAHEIFSIGYAFNPKLKELLNLAM